MTTLENVPVDDGGAPEARRLIAAAEEEVRSLQSLAERATVTLDSLLSEKEGSASPLHVALAWIRFRDATLLHEVRGYLGLIRNEVYLAHAALAHEAARDCTPALLSRLKSLNDAAEQLWTKIKILAESDEDWSAVSSIHINGSLVRHRKDQAKGPRLEEVPLRILCSLGDDATVCANAYWLNRAIDILLGNAVEATRNQINPDIVLGTRRCETWAEIYVEDNGVGMPEEVLRNLFNGRVRGSGSRGLGVGLLMANAMVKAYGGRMGCANRRAGGTSMIISLPLEEH